jgi:hypothetical protein
MKLVVRILLVFSFVVVAVDAFASEQAKPSLLESELACMNRSANGCLNASLLLQKSGNLKDAERRSMAACQLDASKCHFYLRDFPNARGVSEAKNKVRELKKSKY